MSLTPLTTNAESVRNEIKALISDASVLKDDGRGNKMYGSDVLYTKVPQLVCELGVEVKTPNSSCASEVTDSNLQGWGWTLWEFSEPRKIVNKTGQMHLIPLSKGSAITPGGDLVEGYSTFISDEPTLSPNVQIIFIAPKLK